METFAALVVKQGIPEGLIGKGMTGTDARYAEPLSFTENIVTD
jgi:hypothetical protein